MTTDPLRAALRDWLASAGQDAGAVERLVNAAHDWLAADTAPPGHAPMPPEGGDLRIVYKASEVIALGNRRYDEGYAVALAADTAPLDAVDGCINIVQQSLDTVRAEDDGESRSIAASIAAREHVIALLTGYRARLAKERDQG